MQSRARVFRLEDVEVGELIGQGFYGNVYKVLFITNMSLYLGHSRAGNA